MTVRLVLPVCVPQSAVPNPMTSQWSCNLWTTISSIYCTVWLWTTQYASLPLNIQTWYWYCRYRLLSLIPPVTDLEGLAHITSSQVKNSEDASLCGYIWIDALCSWLGVVANTSHWHEWILSRRIQSELLSKWLAPWPLRMYTRMYHSVRFWNCKTSRSSTTRTFVCICRGQRPFWTNGEPIISWMIFNTFVCTHVKKMPRVSGKW